ncbi:MAG: bacteriophage abortive infection AbiH family protein, partial [Oscillospiraceae bacterium]
MTNFSKAAENKMFNVRLKDWNLVGKDEIHPEKEQVLYIIGNGFDLMHGVPSSYYDFRDSLGKRNYLREVLETYLMVDDAWADFEGALAKFNMKAMGSSFMAEDSLDLFGACDEDAGAAEFFMASEAAANPIVTVAEDLPKFFRRWVESLSIATEERPLQNMLKDGKVLCFNYTEFVETLYGVSKENVCYIHGCRRKEKHCPKEKLILGHMSGASDDAFDFDDDAPRKTKNQYKLGMIEAAQENIIKIIADSDEELTKNSGDIILAHEAFFASLNNIKEIIVIGHSFAQVDWAYFSRIVSALSDVKAVRWYFGCHGLRDLNHLEKMLEELRLEKSQAFIFRTAEVEVKLLHKEKNPPSLGKGRTEKTWCTSDDGRWRVKTKDRLLTIENLERHELNYEIMLSNYITNAFFVLSGEYLFVITGGFNAGVSLFNNQDNHWKFLNQLESIENQSVINPRLRQVFLDHGEVVFVYNNRVRKHSL